MQKLYQFNIFFLILSLSLSFLGLVGCNALSSFTAGDPIARTRTLVDISIQYATVRTIERSGNSAATADRIMYFASQAKSFISTGPGTTVEALGREIRNRIPWSDMKASDVILVEALLSMVKQELLNRSNQGVVDDSVRFGLNEVLDTIISTAALFAET